MQRSQDADVQLTLLSPTTIAVVLGMLIRERWKREAAGQIEKGGGWGAGKKREKLGERGGGRGREREG